MTTAVVVPCFNEQDRIEVWELVRFCRTSGLMTVFVDDGSTDDTADLLAGVVGEVGGQARLVRLGSNSGKGEAVRRGLQEALAHGASVVGFADADLATPTAEIARLAAIAEDAPVDVLLGARVKLAGRVVQRQAHRHYLGRVIATYIVLRTGLDVYDTQCGTKFFRASSELRAALSEPFGTRWLFDVELLRRLHLEHAKAGRALLMREEPLETWTDVGGTRLRGREMLNVATDFVRLEAQMRATASRRRPMLGAVPAAAAVEAVQPDPVRRATA